MDVLMNETQSWFCDKYDLKKSKIEKNQNISFLNLMNTKKYMVRLLKNMNLLTKKKMKGIIYSMILLKIEKKIIFINSNIGVYMTIYL